MTIAPSKLVEAIWTYEQNGTSHHRIPSMNRKTLSRPGSDTYQTVLKTRISNQPPNFPRALPAPSTGVNVEGTNVRARRAVADDLRIAPLHHRGAAKATSLDGLQRLAANPFVRIDQGERDHIASITISHHQRPCGERQQLECGLLSHTVGWRDVSQCGVPTTDDYQSNTSIIYCICRKRYTAKTD